MESDKFTKKQMNDFDDLLTQLGTGKWNIFVIIACSLSAMRVPAQVMSGAFVTPSLNYTCLLPSTASSSNTSVTSDQCHYWDHERGTQEKCTQWEFDTSVFTTTMTSEFNLVCSRSYVRSTYSSLYMVGAMFGSLLAGFLADRKGRKAAVTVGIVSLCVFPFIVSWSSSLTIIMISRMFLGVAHPIILSSCFAISMEVCQTRHRSIVGILIGLPWGFGMMALGGLAYFIRAWRWLNLVASLPSLLFIPYIWLLDESPRWLIVQGRHAEAIQIIRKAAKMNKASLPADEELKAMMVATAKRSNSQQKTLPDQSQGKKYVKDLGLLFSNSEIRLRTFVMWILFFAASMVYYGVSMSGNSLSADPFIYMILGGLMELPSYTLVIPIVGKWGRKLPTSVGFLVSGVTILSLAITSKDMPWLVMTLAMTGKFAITTAYQIISMYILELLPTEVRIQGLGTSMFVSRIGSIMSPYIIDNLSQVIPWLSPVIFGVVSIVASASTLQLPDTTGIHMPDTVAELENFSQKTEELQKTLEF